MNVKDKKRGRPSGNGRSLSHDVIIKKAKNLMLTEGKIPSIRQLASALSVDAMAIYHYFKNKNTLLEAITTSLINDIYEPQENDDWQVELNCLCCSYLDLLEQYSGLLETLLSMQLEGPVEIFKKRFTAVVSSLNLDAKNTDDALSLLVEYLHGFALTMKCNTDKAALNIEMIKGPLSLYCKAIQQA